MTPRLTKKNGAEDDDVAAIERPFMFITRKSYVPTARKAIAYVDIRLANATLPALARELTRARGDARPSARRKKKSRENLEKRLWR